MSALAEHSRARLYACLPPMSDLFVITTYFNPCGYATRRENYDRFMAGMRRAGVPCITVECAFGDDAFELPASLGVIQVRSKTLEPDDVHNEVCMGATAVGVACGPCGALVTWPAS